MTYINHRGERIASKISQHVITDYIGCYDLLHLNRRNAGSMGKRARELGVDDLAVYVRNRLSRGDCILCADSDISDGQGYISIHLTKLSVCVDRATLEIMNVYTPCYKRGKKHSKPVHEIMLDGIKEIYEY